MLAVARRIPLGEALPVALLLAFALTAIGPRPALVGAVWLAVVTPRLVAVDLAEHRLPDAVVLPGYPVVLGAVVAEAWWSGRTVTGALLAGAACGLVFLVLHVAGGMGFGDVKLAPLLAGIAEAALPGGALIWLVVAFLAGGLASVGVLVRRGTGARLPFGPPMLLAAWTVLVLAG